MENGFGGEHMGLDGLLLIWRYQLSVQKTALSTGMGRLGQYHVEIDGTCQAQTQTQGLVPS